MTALNRPILYSFRRCPYAMRARMALARAGIQCVLREVILKDKPQQMLSISAKGTVPILLLPDGTVIDESLDIMLWAEMRHSDGSSQAADMIKLVERNDSHFKYHLDRYKYPEHFAVDTDAVFHRQQAELFLADLNQRLGQDSYLCGGQASLTDIALFPFVRQFAAIEPDWFAATPYSYLQTWLTRWLESELFRSVMIRYPQWHPDDVEQLLF
ncbi:MAG: glutathione S-transferase [Mariprofundus sp.]|nr:glutathione S-transferase [Mariprofundus sp.]